MADMTWNSSWAAVTVVEDFIQPCNYKISVDFNTGSDDPAQQHMAFARIKFFVEEVLNQSVFMSLDSPFLPVFKKSQSKIIGFGNAPLEVIITASLWSKIEAFTEGVLELERISLSCDIGEGLINHIDAEFMDSVKNDLLSDPVAEHKEKIWWNRADMGVCDWIEIIPEEDKIRALVRLDTEAWPEFLQWDFQEKSIDDEKKDNIVSLKGKWKPEVIPGDKA